MASEGDSKRVLHRVKDTLKIDGPDPSITDLLDFYLNNTNMHGMRRIAVSKGPIKKTIWIVFSLIAVAMVFWQGIQLIQSFYSIAVSVTINYQKLPFPAITVCSLNPYKYNQSQALLEKLDRNTAVALHNIGIAVTNLSAAKRDDEPLPIPLVWLDTTVTNQTVVTDVISGKFHVVPGEVEMRSYFSQNYQSSEPLIAIEVCGEERKCIYNAFTSAIDAVIQWYRLHFINIMAIVPEKDKDKLGYSADEFIIDCLFSGTVCDPSTSFKKLQHPILGNCFTFNDGSDGKSLDIASAGIDYGLHMVLNTRQDNSLPYLAMGAGAKIGIHLQNTTPFIEAVGIDIPPAMESSLGLRVNDVQKLGDPYSDCTMDGSDIDVKSLYDSPYSVQTCQNSCFQWEMIKSCGCANYEQPLPEGSRFCNYDNNPGWEYCYYRLYDMYIKEELKCIQVCRQICSETEHEVTLSLADWPSKASKERHCHCQHLLQRSHPEDHFRISSEQHRDIALQPRRASGALAELLNAVRRRGAGDLLRRLPVDPLEEAAHDVQQRVRVPRPRPRPRAIRPLPRSVARGWQPGGGPAHLPHGDAVPARAHSDAQHAAAPVQHPALAPNRRLRPRRGQRRRGLARKPPSALMPGVDRELPSLKAHWRGKYVEVNISRTLFCVSA
ncbi:epithelial sodium channel subunit gamma-like isoform X1 [Petromyzon marinus]|uniref:Amiloride-sensitive sodium channel subunit gamma-like isoform X1 n=1 Tax=Petromyzon marinus TaxID=7757 RepID=A0AAJ7X142_PETMA|nr:amiloride-sensitive sodium channel subunit gamma-like isoform X1 [Petromyzon marinus]